MLTEFRQEQDEHLVFRARDFAAPATSPTFRRLRDSRIAPEHIDKFAAICSASYWSVPRLVDFAPPMRATSALGPALRVPRLPHLPSPSAMPAPATAAPLPTRNGRDAPPVLAPQVPSPDPRRQSVAGTVLASDRLGLIRSLGKRVEIVGRVTRLSHRSGGIAGREYLIILETNHTERVEVVFGEAVARQLRKGAAGLQIGEGSWASVIGVPVRAPGAIAVRLLNANEAVPIPEPARPLIRDGLPGAAAPATPANHDSSKGGRMAEAQPSAGPGLGTSTDSTRAAERGARASGTGPQSDPTAWVGGETRNSTMSDAFSLAGLRIKPAAKPATSTAKLAAAKPAAKPATSTAKLAAAKLKRTKPIYPGTSNWEVGGLKCPRCRRIFRTQNGAAWHRANFYPRCSP